MTQPMPWYVPPEVANAPDELPGGFRYDADSFFTGEISVQLIEASPHAKGGSGQATSIKLVLGAEAPEGQGIRWDEYLGLDLSKDYSIARQKAFLNAFAPGYLGSDAHRKGEAPVDLAQLAGRWALCTVKKEIDTFEGRPPRNKPRVITFIEAIPAALPVDPSKVKTVVVEIPQQGGGLRGPAPGARPPRAAAPTAGAPAPVAPAPGARPAPVPARPVPPAPVQQSFTPPPATREDDDLPY